MRILGVDPGIATVGFAVLDAEKRSQRLLTCGVITTPAKTQLSSRLDQIYRDLNELIAQFHPEVMAVEELFFNTNITTGIAVAHGRGIILLSGYQAGLQIYEYTPGFIHAKMFTSDDEKAVVGTINLDFRSLYLHFECASYFFRGCDGCGRRFPENTCKERADYSGKLPEVSVYPAVCGEGTADSGAAYVELQNERYGIFMFS